MSAKMTTREDAPMARMVTRGVSKAANAKVNYERKASPQLQAAAAAHAAFQSTAANSSNSSSPAKKIKHQLLANNLTDKEKVSALQRQLDDQAKTISSLKQSMADSDKRHAADISRIQRRHNEELAELDETSRQYRAFSTASINTLEKDQAALATEYVTLSDEKSNLESQLEDKQSEIDSIKEEKTKLQAQLEAYKNEVEAHKEESQRARGIINSQQEVAQSLKMMIHKKDGQLQQKLEAAVVGSLSSQAAGKRLHQYQSGQGGQQQQLYAKGSALELLANLASLQNVPQNSEEGDGDDEMVLSSSMDPTNKEGGGKMPLQDDDKDDVAGPASAFKKSNQYLQLHALKKSNQSLQQSLQSKEERIHLLEDTVKEIQHAHSRQLGELQTSYDQLLLAARTAVKSETEGKTKEVESLREELAVAKKEIDSLKETNQTLENGNTEMEMQIASMEEEAEKSTQVYMTQLTELESKLKSNGVDRLAIQKLQAERDTARREVGGLQASNKSLQQSICLNHDEMKKMREEREEAEQGLRDQLKMSQASCVHALSKHKALESEFDKRLKAVQAVCNDATEKAVKLEGDKQSLVKSICEKEEQIRAIKKDKEELKRGHEETLKELQASLEQIRVDHASLESESKSKMEKVQSECNDVKEKNLSLEKAATSLQESIRLKDEQMQSIKKAAEDSVRGRDMQLKELQTSHEELQAKHEALGREYDQKMKEVQNECHNAKMEVASLKETNQSLQKSVQLKEAHIQSMQKKAEDTESGHKVRLKELEASYEQLQAKHAATMKQSDQKLEEVQAECDNAKKEVNSLKESNQSLQQSVALKDEQIKMMENIAKEVQRTHEQHLKESKASYEELQSKRNAMESEIQLKMEKVQAECDSAKKEVDSLKESSQSLQKSVALKEEQIKMMANIAEEVQHTHEQHLKESKASYDELLAKNTALKQESEQKSKEMDLERNDAKKTIEALEQSKQSLEESLRLKEGEIQTTKAEAEESERRYKEKLEDLQASCEELQSKQTSIQTESDLKIKVLRAEYDNVMKDVDELQEAKQSLEKSIRSKDDQINMMENIGIEVQQKHRQQQEELQASYDGLLAQHTQLQSDSDLNIREVQGECDDIKKKMEALEMSKQSLERSLRLKDEEIKIMMKEKEESECGYKQQLKELQASHDNLVEKQAGLQNDTNVKSRDLQSSKGGIVEADESNHTLQEPSQSLQQSISSKNEQISTMENKAKESEHVPKQQLKQLQSSSDQLLSNSSPHDSKCKHAMFEDGINAKLDPSARKSMDDSPTHKNHSGDSQDHGSNSALSTSSAEPELTNEHYTDDVSMSKVIATKEKGNATSESTESAKACELPLLPHHAEEEAEMKDSPVLTDDVSVAKVIATKTNENATSEYTHVARVSDVTFSPHHAVERAEMEESPNLTEDASVAKVTTSKQLENATSEAPTSEVAAWNTDSAGCAGARARDGALLAHQAKEREDNKESPIHTNNSSVENITTKQTENATPEAEKLEEKGGIGEQGSQTSDPLYEINHIQGQKSTNDNTEALLPIAELMCEHFCRKTSRMGSHADRKKSALHRRKKCKNSGNLSTDPVNHNSSSLDRGSDTGGSRSPDQGGQGQSAGQRASNKVLDPCAQSAPDEVSQAQACAAGSNLRSEESVPRSRKRKKSEHTQSNNQSQGNESHRRSRRLQEISEIQSIHWR